jgi:hypothetical protein
MRKKLFTSLALMVTMALGCIVFESSAFAQNTNSSTTSEKHMSGSNTGHRRHRRRWHRRRHRRGGMEREKTGNANKH